MANDASISLASGNGSLALPNGFAVHRIMINVRGPGIASPIFYVWNSEGPGGVVQTPPSEVSISVPSGNDRLIQYLAVYENEDSENLFFYGDKLTSLTSGPNPVEITAAQISASTTETSLLGRYIRSDGTFPTGKVRIEFTPPNGRPNMTVDFKEVFGGWLSLFTFSGVNFTFTMVDTNEVLFENISAATLRPVGIGTLNPHSLLVQLPGHFKDHGNTCTNDYYEATRNIIFGYFGPGATGKKVCYQSSTASSTGLYTRSGSACGSAISWTTSLITENNTSYGNVLGGFGSSDSSNVPSCNEGAISDQMKFPYQKFRHGGKDEILAEGPYEKVNGTSITFNGNDLNNLAISWYYLPGSLIGPFGVKGTDIYKKANMGPGNQVYARRYAEDGLTCTEATTKAGYSFVTSVPNATVFYNLIGTVAADDRNSDGLFNEGDYQIVLCPYYNKANGEKAYYSGLAESYAHAPMRAKLQSTNATFPNTEVGSSINQVITINNVGNSVASSMNGSNSNAEFTYVGGSYPGTGGTCTTTLFTASSCTINVSFTPASTGPRTGTVTVNYNNGNSAQSRVINTTGNGTPSMALLTIAPTSFDFGYYSPGGPYNSGVFTVTNSGTAAATGMTFSGLGATPFATNPGYTCVNSITTLAPGASCTIAVTYTASPAETASATLHINYLGGAASSLPFNISGRTVP